MLGAAGNRTGVTEANGRQIAWTYDALYRLTNETISGDTHGQNGSIGYQYDAVGNRLQRNSSVAAVPTATSAYDANDRLTSDTYDANGNTTNSQGKTYGYDFENRLTQLTDGGNGATYIYDGDGNRVGKIAGGVTTNYLVDTNNLTGYAQVVEEIVSGQVTKQFTYGHDLISQRIIGGSVSFYGYDGHGSVRLLTNAAGSVTDTYDYDAFGNLISRTGATDNEYLYTGERFDGNLGFYYLRARYMNPNSGRFFTQDSFEGYSSDPITLHKYTYANNNPNDSIDPSGHSSLIESLQALAISNILTAISFAAAGQVFIVQNADRIQYWLNWLELGWNAALVTVDITSRLGAVQYEVPNNFPTGRTGDRGENTWINELQNKGFTDIVQIQNAQNNGIDVVARDPHGRIHAFEVKATTGDRFPSLSGDQTNPDLFIRSRLEQAARGTGRYGNIAGTNVQSMAESYLEELRSNGFRYTASKIQVKLPPTGGSPNLNVLIRLSQWLPSRRR